MKKYLIVLMCLSLILWWFIGWKIIGFKATIEQNKVGLHFQRHNAYGLMQLIIWEKDSRSILWYVNLNYYPGGIIKYGEVPKEFTTFNGVKNFATQKYPKNNKLPEQIPFGKEIYVYINYMHDKFFILSTSVKVYSFVWKDDGTIQNMGEVSMPPPGAAPEIFD